MSEAAFAVAWTGPAQRTLRRLPTKAATAPVEFIYGSLAGHAQQVGTPLRSGLAGLRSARRGGYRVIYRINTGEHRIEIVAIGHRAGACTARLYEQAARDAERLREDPDDVAEIRAVNEELNDEG